MGLNSVIDVLPIWGLVLASFLLTLLSIGCGLRLGARRNARPDREQSRPVGIVVGSVLGLYAFLLAFVFGLAANRYEVRRMLVYDATVAIESCWLRAGLLPEPARGQIRALLNEYITLRVAATHHVEDLLESARDAEDLHKRLWAMSEALSQHEDTQPAVRALFYSALSEVIASYRKHVAGAYRRVPEVIWFALFTVGAFSGLLVGFLFGLSGTGSTIASLAFAFAFSITIGLIADLDNPTSGTFVFDQTPLVELQQRLAR